MKFLLATHYITGPSADNGDVELWTGLVFPAMLIATCLILLVYGFSKRQ